MNLAPLVIITEHIDWIDIPSSVAPTIGTAAAVGGVGLLGYGGVGVVVPDAGLVTSSGAGGSSAGGNYGWVA